MKPSERWDLTLRDRVTADGREWCVYSDGQYTWAVLASDWDAETDQEDYSLWCCETLAAGDEQLCRAILAECDPVEVPILWAAGSFLPIERGGDS